MHRENRENDKKNPCQGKHREFGNFAKTQGNHREFGLLKLLKDISIFAAKIFFFFRSLISLPSHFCVCNNHKSHKLAQGKFAVRQGKHGEFENAG